MKVLFSPLVRSCFQEMEEILYEKEYFGFEDSAIQYVRELIYEIRDTLPKCQKKPALTYFNIKGNDYNSVIVSFYVENVPLAANTVHTVKIIFYISETLPFGLLCSFEPI